MDRWLVTGTQFLRLPRRVISENKILVCGGLPLWQLALFLFSTIYPPANEGRNCDACDGANHSTRNPGLTMAR
jgi:hypothetical protein